MKIPYDNINRHIIYDENKRQIGSVIKKQNDDIQKIKKLERTKINIDIRK